MTILQSHERIAEAAAAAPCPYAVGDQVTECERCPNPSAKRVEDWDYVPLAIATVTDVSKWPQALSLSNGYTLRSVWETAMFVRHTKPADAETIERRQLGRLLSTIPKSAWERLPIEELRSLAARLRTP